MFLRRAFPERDSEVVFGLVFVPFGWPFSLPLISVSQRNPSRVLKFFCLSNRLCFCGGMCLAMCFLSLRFAIFRSCFIVAWGLLSFYFYCAFFAPKLRRFQRFFCRYKHVKRERMLTNAVFSDAKNQFFEC